MSDNPEIAANQAPQEAAEEKKTVVEPTPGEIKFDMAQVKAMMSAYADSIIKLNLAKSPQESNQIINNYEETLRSHVNINQSNLVRPSQNTRPPVDSLQYVNDLLGRENQQRSSNASGWYGTAHDTELEILNDKIYIMHEEGNSPEAIANELKSEIERIV